MNGQIVMVGMGDITAADLTVMKNAADVLERHYPGHRWMTTCKKGVLDIYNGNLSGQMGYRIKEINCFSATDLAKEVVKAGGEILERYRQPRGSFNLDRILTAPQNKIGNHVADR